MPKDAARLLRLLENQGLRELVSAHLFANAVALAPTLDDKHMLADHAREELAHFERVALVYEEVGGASLFDAVGARAARVPLPASWLEAAVAGYLIDRAAAVQLAAYRGQPDPQLAAMIAGILEHENEHLEAAEVTLREQCRPAAAREQAAAFVERWFARGVELLDDGDPEGTVRRAFAAAVAPALRDTGLAAPTP